MKELGITKGEWLVDFNRVPNGMESLSEQISIRTDEWDIACAFIDITDEGDEEKANAMLIADAGNTAQKCGLLPSELLQQRDELREVLKRFIECMRRYWADTYQEEAPDLSLVIEAEAAIKNTER